jgi:hypothetical protein
MQGRLSPKPRNRPESDRPENLRPDLGPVNTGSGITYTCDPSVSSATCDYLNTTVASYYNDTFTNANADIYIEYGTTGLGESTYYFNFVRYSQYVTALGRNSQSAIQASALSALNTYDATPYGSDNVEVTAALGAALGFTGMTGITTDEGSCTLPASGCYNGIITVIDDPQDYGFSLYYDNLGGSEPSDAYDFYAVVEHETDELLGTASCIDTQGDPLADDCGSGVPSAVDLFRYSSAGNLVLDSSLSTTPGAYFSFNGGSTNGADGVAGTAKVYNTLDNGDDYADFVSSSPDCGTNEAIQDAEGCPGEDKGLTIFNDGEGEINILTAVGFSVPNTVAPAPGSMLPASSVTFSWSSTAGASGYQFWLGSTGRGSTNIYSSGEVMSSTFTSVTVNNLPLNGETIYARLYTLVDGAWLHRDFTYIAAAAATLTAPAQGATLPGPVTTFTWTAPASATAYQLWLGTTGVNSNNLCSTGVTHVNTITRTNMPTNGETIYARLFTDIDGTWTSVNYTFIAAQQSAPVSPAVGATLAGPVQTFTWTTATGANAAAYQFWLGSTGAGSNDVYSSGVIHTTSVTRTTLPVNGETLYARIYTDYNGTWVHQDYTLVAAAQATPTSPAPNSTLPGASVQFTWSAATGGATQYQLWLGSTGVGSNNLYSSGAITATTVTRNNLPTNGEKIYARLYTNFSGTWTHIDYTLTAAP